MTPWQHILAVDHDAHACETYRANMPGVEVVCGSVEAALVRKYRGEIDVLCGGPPCQGYSKAGRGLGEADPRDGFPVSIECVAASMPRQVLFENVAGLLAEKHIRHFGRVIEALERVGYRVEYQVLDAFRFGVPQFRNRVWIWGIRRDLWQRRVRHKWPAPTHGTPEEIGPFSRIERWVTVREAIGLITDGGVPYPYDRKHIVKHPPAIADEPAPTIVSIFEKLGACGFVAVYDAQRKGSAELGEYVRRLTPGECARLQSCPPDWAWPSSVPKTARYRIVGNGWACGMAAAMARSLREADPEAVTVVDLFCGGGLGAAGWCGRYWQRAAREVTA